MEEIAAIYERANGIWAPAGIQFDVQTIQRIDVPTIYLEALAVGDYRPFFNAAGEEVSIPDPSLINGFYARSIGGPNGFTPFGSQVFFVMDEPSVHDERVTSHETGHILGLHHTIEDTDRLLYPGTNGETLTAEEITVARYVAQGLLDGVR